MCIRDSIRPKSDEVILYIEGEESKTSIIMFLKQELGNILNSSLSVIEISQSKGRKLSPSQAKTYKADKQTTLNLPQRKEGEVCLEYIRTCGKTGDKKKHDRIARMMNQDCKNVDFEILNVYRFTSDEKTLGDIRYPMRVFMMMDMTTLNDTLEINKHSTLFVDHISKAYIATSMLAFVESKKIFKISDDKYAIAQVNLRDDCEQYMKPFEKLNVFSPPEHNDHAPFGWVEYVVEYNYEMFQ
eukprot:TRINITY_DN13231_c0_g1_i1.p1 TRINITY_DN13231_c0_g1~~TRINITY_DN13231_c0_g1_i1.p1  ORF type:complete len:263 (-),score=59.87 TRINITY_DN13231_c0_g1_i1:260-985(-)